MCFGLWYLIRIHPYVLFITLIIFINSDISYISLQIKLSNTFNLQLSNMISTTDLPQYSSIITKIQVQWLYFSYCYEIYWLRAICYLSLRAFPKQRGHVHCHRFCSSKSYQTLHKPLLSFLTHFYNALNIKFHFTNPILCFWPQVLVAFF